MLMLMERRAQRAFALWRLPVQHTCGGGPFHLLRPLRTRGPDSGARDYARTLLHTVGTVRVHVGQYLRPTRWPGDFNSGGLTKIAHAEVKAQVILRQVAPAAPHLLCLYQVTRDDLHPRIQCQSVPLCPGELEADPVIARAGFGAQDHRLAFENFDHDFLDAVVEQVPDGQAPSDSWKLQRRPCLTAYVTECAVSLVH